MRRLAMLFVVIAAVFALGACGGGDNKTKNSTSESSASSSSVAKGAAALGGSWVFDMDATIEQMGGQAAGNAQNKETVKNMFKDFQIIFDANKKTISSKMNGKAVDAEQPYAIVSEKGDEVVIKVADVQEMTFVIKDEKTMEMKAPSQGMTMSLVLKRAN